MLTAVIDIPHLIGITPSFDVLFGSCLQSLEKHRESLLGILKRVSGQVGHSWLSLSPQEAKRFDEEGRDFSD